MWELQTESSFVFFVLSIRDKNKVDLKAKRTSVTRVVVAIGDSRNPTCGEVVGT